MLRRGAGAEHKMAQYGYVRGCVSVFVCGVCLRVEGVSDGVKAARFARARQPTSDGGAGPRACLCASDGGGQARGRVGGRRGKESRRGEGGMLQRGTSRALLVTAAESTARRFACPAAYQNAN